MFRRKTADGKSSAVLLVIIYTRERERERERARDGIALFDTAVYLFLYAVTFYCTGGHYLVISAL